MRQKFVNAPATVVSEMITGFVGAFPHHYELHPDTNALLFRGRRTNKVALVTGGGSGHEPLFAGFVGSGLADAAVCGDLYNAPSPESIYQTAKAVESGNGVVFLYGTFPGDILNFDIAEEQLRAEGIATGHIRVHDDITSAPVTRKKERRGVAGDVFLLRLAGAACDAGLSIPQIVDLAEEANDRVWSIGAAITHFWDVHPHALNTLPQNQVPCIEYGIGLHGEQGILRTEMQPANQLVDKMYSQLQDEAQLSPGDEVCVLVNGLGSISIMELAIIFQRVKKRLEDDGLRVLDADFNNYCASYTSNGFSITLLHTTAQMQQYLCRPCHTPFYTYQPGSCRSYPAPPVKHTASPLITDREIPYTPVHRDPPHPRAMDTLLLRDMMIHTAGQLIDAEAYLSELDSMIGDGDHGICIANGMRRIRQRLMAIPADRGTLPFEIFNIMGRTMLLVGGASGTFFGSMYNAAAETMKGKALIQVSDFAQMWEAAVFAIKKKGGAKEGDKTLIDALSPAVAALKDFQGRDYLTALQAAEEAAQVGMQHTKEMAAKFGRGKFLSERVLGCQDAGATTIWITFKSMREFWEMS